MRRCQPVFTGIFWQNRILGTEPAAVQEQMTIGLERVFEISNFYRAENSHTGRHLSEFTSIDIEAAFMDYHDVMNVLESLIINVYKFASENCKAEQEAIGHVIETPRQPFERVTYSQCVEELQKSGEKIEFGDDLLDSHLRIIGDAHPGFFFLTDWPMKLKPFYIRKKTRMLHCHAHLTCSMDIWNYHLAALGFTSRDAKGASKEQDLDPSQFQDHLKTFEWGMPPHSGWGMGAR